MVRFSPAAIITADGCAVKMTDMQNALSQRKGILHLRCGHADFT